jgi:hypothetical protein
LWRLKRARNILAALSKICCTLWLTIVFCRKKKFSKKECCQWDTQYREILCGKLDVVSRSKSHHWSNMEYLMCLLFRSSFNL